MKFLFSIPRDRRRHPEASNNSKNRITGNPGEIGMCGFFGNSSFSTGGNLGNRDLPAIRDSMSRYAEDATHSEKFRAVFRAVVVAIGQARDEDESTHTPLEQSLNRFVEAGNEEAARFERLLEYKK